MRGSDSERLYASSRLLNRFWVSTSTPAGRTFDETIEEFDLTGRSPTLRQLTGAHDPEADAGLPHDAHPEAKVRPGLLEHDRGARDVLVEERVEPHRSPAGIDVKGSHRTSLDPACATRRRLKPPVRPALSATLSSVEYGNSAESGAMRPAVNPPVLDMNSHASPAPTMDMKKGAGPVVVEDAVEPAAVQYHVTVGRRDVLVHLCRSEGVTRAFCGPPVAGQDHERSGDSGEPTPEIVTI